MERGDKNNPKEGAGSAVKLKYWVGGGWKESKTEKYMNCYDPSTGEVIALAPQCAPDEVESAVAAAQTAFPDWSATPASKRAQVLFRLKALLDSHLDELTRLLATENGKVLDEAMGDVLKVTEVVEFACGITHLLKGPSLMNCTTGYDTVQYLEPLGVFAGIAPWNFPAMIPMGWMAPLCLATGNTMVLKAASFIPANLDADHGTLGRGGTAPGRPQPRHLLEERGRDPPAPPGREGRLVRRLYLRRQAYILDRSGEWQTRPGPHRGQEPRSRPQGRRPRADSRRHHELGLRLRGRALHGAAGRRGGGGDRGQVRGPPREEDVQSGRRAGLREG